MDYCWGKEAFEELAKSISRKLTSDGQYYRLHGMPYVMQVWMYDCCSKVDKRLTKRVGDLILRLLNWKTIKDRPRYKWLMKNMFMSKKASASEIAAFQLPPKIVHNVTVVNSLMNDVVNSDDEFQDMRSISLARKGQSKISISVSPLKRKQKQKQMSSGESISIKTPTKVVSNAAVSNISPLLDNKTIKKSTLNKKSVEEQIQSPHNIEPPMIDAVVKSTILIHDLNILNQKVDALEIYVKSHFQNQRNLINANHKAVMDAIKSKDIDEKSNMDVNHTPSYLYVPVVREHNANVNVQPEMDSGHEDVGIKDQSFDPMEVTNTESTLKIQNAEIYIEELVDDVKNMASGYEDVAKKYQSFDPMKVDETKVDCEEGDHYHIDVQYDL
ncbi:hypothetical protein FXO37_03180 [Capsicum annuum]|nr:hypothetical protein FXO37_03180 [Capsicum annuum]